MSRWYDKRPRLGERLDEFKNMDEKIREPILKHVINVVGQMKTSLLSEEQARKFRFDSYRLRWYEHDPYCWFVFNVLEIADVDILKSVEDYLNNREMLEV